MEITTQYIISQIFTVISYMLLASTYQVKNRKAVLTLNLLGQLSFVIAYSLLGAWSGLTMTLLAIIRNIIFIVDENKNGKREKINKSDIIILIILYVISIISAIYTYDGFLSLFSVFATMLYTFSVWQKKTSIYKILGIPIGILWILYNTYIMSIFGIILESVLFIYSITGYILEKRNKC
jgi:hypothetical protein